MRKQGNYEERTPMVDDGVIGLVALCLLAQGQARASKEVALASRVLAHAVARLDANEAEVAAEIERRNGKDPSNATE